MHRTKSRDRTSRRLGAGVVTAVTAALALGACGGDDEGSGSVDLADGLPSAAVCNGDPSDAAPAASEPFAGYAYLNDGDGWSSAWFDVFGDQQAIVGDDATTIMCVTVAASTETDRCDYEQDGDTFTLVLVDADYDVELRTAESAEVVASDSFTVTAEDCPGFTSWTVGETERTSFPVPGADQIAASFGEFIG